MELLLVEFINTLDLSLKKLQKEIGDSSGFSSLTISQLQYIDAIHALGTPAITEIANELNITKASVTAGVNKLIDMGYLTKTQSEEDKRVFHVSLTAAGQQLTVAKAQALQEYAEFITQVLSEEEARQFEAIMKKLVEQFRQAPFINS
jgi:DNA-binding MarR family transcriptional regulator